MRSAFATRGKSGVEMAWWHMNNFPKHRFADVMSFIDDRQTIVLEDVLELLLALASGVIVEARQMCNNFRFVSSLKFGMELRMFTRQLASAAKRTLKRDPASFYLLTVNRHPSI